MLLEPDAPNLVLLIGDPVEHTLSPHIQNAAFGAAGIPWVYAPRRVSGERLEAVLEALRLLRLGGANITVPHKVAALRNMDALDREARIVGAVNTVSVTEGGLRGSNTDVAGFSAALEETLPDGLTGEVAVVLGAGGAARAVVWALVRDGWAEHIGVVNRNLERGQVLINAIRDGQGRKGGSGVRFDLLQDAEALSPELKERTGLIVNATPLGQGALSGESPLPDVEGFPEGTLVFDLVYAPAPTPLIQAARSAGLPAIDGKEMLLHQGARSFEIWTGERAPIDAMRDALRSALQRGEE